MNYEELIAAGFSPDEARAYLAKNGGAIPAPQPADATRTSIPAGAMLAGGAAGVGGLGYGIVKGAQAAGRGVVRRTAQTQLRRAVEEAPGGVQALIRRIQEFNATGRGESMTFSDLDPRLTAEADYTATNNPRARNELGALNTERRRAMPQRLLADVERIAPGGYADAPGIIQQSRAEQQAFARGPEGYEGLRQANPTIAPEGAGRLAQFLENPRTAKLWQDAAADGAIGPLPKADALSFETLQGFRDRLGSLKEAAWRRGDGDLGRRLNAAFDELTNIMETSVPGFKDVNARYRQYSEAQSAVEMGQDLWRDKSLQLPELQRRIAAVTPAQRELLQKGILGAYIADLENARKNSGFFEEMSTALPVQQKKLELVFGGREGFLKALQTYEQEIAMARLGSAVGGSATAAREGQQARAATEAVGEAAHLLAHPVTGVPTVARGAFAKWLPGAVAEEMRPAVTTRGGTALEELLRTLMKVR